MFTGIVEELGEIVAIDPQGDSVALAIRGPLSTTVTWPLFDKTHSATSRA